MQSPERRASPKRGGEKFLDMALRAALTFVAAAHSIFNSQGDVAAAECCVFARESRHLEDGASEPDTDLSG